MTLADEDTNSILTDNANMPIQSNVAMEVIQPGGKFVTYPSGPTIKSNNNNKISLSTATLRGSHGLSAKDEVK